MSIAVIEIVALAHYKLLDSSPKQAKGIIRDMICDLLGFLGTLTPSEQSAYNLSFVAKRRQLRIFLIIHCKDNSLENLTADQISDQVMTHLRNAFYSCKKLFGTQMTESVLEMRDILHGDTVMLQKSERLMTSGAAYSGYFYYTDTLESDKKHPCDLDNYDALFDLLIDTDQSLVSFQLIPTTFSQSEVYSLSSLASELKSVVQGIPMSGRIYRDNSAEEPQRTYAYYTEQRSQPVFFCNILIASGSDHADSIAAALKTSIQSSVSHPISIDMIPVDMDKQMSRDFFSLPWNLANTMLFNYRDQSIWNGSPFQPTNLMRLPFLYTAEEASAFFRIPIDDGIIHGIRSNKVANTNESIDERVTDAENVQFGTLLNSPNTLIGASLSDFMRHGLIVGTPGSGKTTFAINLLLQLYRKCIPFLAIEPTKTEYRAMLDQIPDLLIFTPGNSEIVPFSINPFVPPEGITVEQYIPSLTDAFKAAFDMESPLDVIFSSAVRKCYIKYGWKNNSKADDKDVQAFGLYEFVLTFKELVSASAYSKDVRSNIETGGTFRLLNLIQQNSTLYDTVNAVDICELLSKPTVLELNSIPNDEQKALLIALLLIQVTLYIKSKGSSSGQLKNMVLLDEAHVLLGGNADGRSTNKAATSAVLLFQKMIAEIRSFGTSVFVADQAPSQVTRSIVANTDIKIAFRLVEKEEREIIANSTRMPDDYMDHLARLQTGEAIVYYSRLETPKIISTPDFREKEGVRLNVSDVEIRERVMAGCPERPFYECRWCEQCKHGCSIAVRNQADYYASRIVILLGAKVNDKDALTKYMFRLHDLIIQYEREERHNLSLKILCNCSKIHFLRKMLLEGKFSLDRRMIDSLLHDTLIPEVNG